jgi:starch synthase
MKLEDLVGMIQDTEKSKDSFLLDTRVVPYYVRICMINTDFEFIWLDILLLNQARLQALERADKFRKEKEILQRKIDILEMKLSETGGQQKLSSEGESGAENSDSQLLMEFDALKEENMLIKDDIKFLKTQLVEITETEKSLFKLEKERALLDASLKELECGFIAAQSDMLKLGPLQHDAWWDKVENLEELLESTAKQVEHASMVLDRYQDFQDKVDKIEASLRTENVSNFCFYLVDLLQQRIKSVEERFKVCNNEMHSQIELYEHSIVEFHDTLSKIIKASEKQSLEHYADGLPSEFWSRISLLIDGWSLEKKVSYNDAIILREMAWKRDNRLREAYLSSRGMEEIELMDSFLKVALPGTRYYYLLF